MFHGTLTVELHLLSVSIFDYDDFCFASHLFASYLGSVGLNHSYVCYSNNNNNNHPPNVKTQQGKEKKIQINDENK